MDNKKTPLNEIRGMASTNEIKALVQPRIYSSNKAKLEDAVPLRTPFSVHIDVCSYCKLKLKESSYRVGFFSENNFIFEYLEFYILNKLKKEKILILSFENIPNNIVNKSHVFVFHTKFFRELVFLTLKLDVLYSSTPDLDHTIFKRSKFSKCKYIYLQL